MQNTDTSNKSWTWHCPSVTQHHVWGHNYLLHPGWLFTPDVGKSLRVGPIKVLAADLSCSAVFSINIGNNPADQPFLFWRGWVEVRGARMVWHQPQEPQTKWATFCLIKDACETGRGIIDDKNWTLYSTCRPPSPLRPHGATQTRVWGKPPWECRRRPEEILTQFCCLGGGVEVV